MKRFFLALAIYVMLAGCTATATPTPAASELIMTPQISMGANGELVLRIGVYNRGQISFPGSEVFDAVVTIADERGSLVNDLRLSQMNPVSVGETVFPAEIRTMLPPGKYAFTWATPGYDTVSFNFAVADRSGVIILRAPEGYLNPDTEFTEIDPSL